MKKTMAVMTAVCIALSVPGAALAQGGGPSPQTQAAANQLGACMARKTSSADRLAFAGWMLAAMAASPDLKDVAKVAPATKDRLDRQVAGLFTRLMTVDCLAEAKALYGTRDPLAFRLAGEPLGRAALGELTSKPEFSAALAAFTKYMDQAKFIELMK